jgi:hypothetical protein
VCIYIYIYTCQCVGVGVCIRNYTIATCVHVRRGRGNCYPARQVDELMRFGQHWNINRRHRFQRLRCCRHQLLSITKATYHATPRSFLKDATLRKTCALCSGSSRAPWVSAMGCGTSWGHHWKQKQRSTFANITMLNKC